MGLSLISASCIAAILTRLICHPLDTLRIHSQLSQKSSLKTNYYKGLGVSLVFSIPGLSSYLSTYDLSKDYIQKSSIFNDDYRKPLFMHSMSAIAAEVVSGLFWTPMEIIKSKQQSETYKHHSSLQISKKIYSNEGIKGFFRGYLVQMVVFVPYTVCYFVVYERLKLKCLANDMGVWSFILSSGMAGGVASVVSSTADVIKTRMQVRSDNMSHVVHDLWKENGYRMLFKGMKSRIIWIVPSVTVSMTVYEMLKE